MNRPDPLALMGRRLKFARERGRLTQQQLADALGMEHRQSLAAVEAGQRRLTAEELVRAMQALGTDLDFFTDAFRLAGEGRFSFRAQPEVSGQVLDSFEERAGRWIATYRELGAQAGETPDWLGHRLKLTSHSRFEEAIAAGEDVAELWRLGECPAEGLQRALEGEMDALVLHVDAPPGISGAASQLPRLSTVLVNRAEPEGRRHFDLAHELFHLLTWDAMPPERVEPVEVPRSGKGRRVEQLAENFAAALLMPSVVLAPRWEQRDASEDLHAWLNRTATELRVSSKALKWRLHNQGFLDRADLLEINDDRLVANGRAADAVPRPRLFSGRFVERIAAALEAGRLSVRRSADLLGVTLPGLAELLLAYGHEPPFEA